VLTPRASIIIPARDEGTHITGMLDRLFRSLPPGCEVLVVVDRPDDSTWPAVAAYRQHQPSPAWSAATAGARPTRSAAAWTPPARRLRW